LKPVPRGQGYNYTTVPTDTLPLKATFWVDKLGEGGLKGAIYTLLALQGKEKLKFQS